MTTTKKPPLKTKTKTKAAPTKARKPKASPTVTDAPKPTVTKSARASAQPKAAPGAIPVGGTDTQVQARNATEIQADGINTQEQALALGKHFLPANTDRPLSEAEAYSLKPEDVDNSTLARVTERFNGVEMTEVPIPSSEALGAQPAVVYTGEAPAFAAQPQPDPAPKTPAQDAFGTAAEQQSIPPAKRRAAVGLHFANRITRLKMTLHGVEQLPGDESNPLTRCSFGAVYSADEMNEDSVYGKATPYANLQYNVRSDLAAGMEVGAAYYIDVQKVPS